MKSTQPLYLSLYEKLKKQIIEGLYHSNDKFPSKRQLSEHLSMSHTTIEHAYQLLLDEGFIYSKPRSGYYVSDIESLPVVNTESYHDYMGNEINEETYNNDGPQYAFNLAEIDSESFPMHIFRKYAKDVFEDDQLDLLQRGEVQGVYALRQQIAHYLFNSRGVTCHPNQIIIGSSTSQLLDMITNLLKHEKFIIEKPSYPPIKHVLDKKNMNYLQVPVDKNGIQIQPILNSQNNVLYITPSHQFPTGHVTNLKKRTQLIQWAQKDTHRYIIEDDYDSEFRYFGKPIPALQSLDTKGKVIYISTFSKSLFPSCRIAYIVLPEKVMNTYKQRRFKEGNTVPVHLQHMVARFMSSGSFERHLNKMRRIYRDKLNYILKKLAQYSEQLKIEGALTGMHFTLTVMNGLSVPQCLEKAKKNNLKLELYNYEDKPSKYPKFILGFGGIKQDELEDHVNALINSLIIK
ncbi:GntR family transcriptional regulator [Staphylococcus sp. HMSC036D05]|uniref:MocR-like pyridoxine biosynthesis transcription factor PdxR n=1 Tax=Staphylococcus sp. HMSC036D05 TaxID=1715059 RepID=UPI0008A8FAE3|nr:PLP-dependent aminotransferase family protein [Staphylococcus sp. HMSC036D05]OHO68514.1 GntR family transcriptional regulator [Staphylococcus sp. HMSC036D05]